MGRTEPATPAAAGARLASLDQFRGYTVAGMFVVNFLGGFALTPAILKHHNTYCSYADTVMPQFLFAVGFALRLTFARRSRQEGAGAAYRRVARRIVVLGVLALVFYTLGAGPAAWEGLLRHPLQTLPVLAKRDWFQTLLHIAVTSLWILPVLGSSPAVRVSFLLASALMHLVLSASFNFAWVNSPPRGIDGGPLGFLTWSIPALVGTLACDAFAEGRPWFTGKPLLWALALMALGYVLSCGTRLYDLPADGQLQENPVLPDPVDLRSRPAGSLLAEPPFFGPPGPDHRQPNYWMMSQRAGSISYQVFAAGLALALFVLFHLACDGKGWQIGLFRTLGSNALLAYVLGGALELALKQVIPREAPWPQVAAGLIGLFGGTYLVVRLLEWKGIFLRV
jgi:hypothetical protein